MIASGIRRIVQRLAAFARPDRAEHELAREIEAHLALIEDEFRRRGMSDETARAEARRALGGVALAQDLHRDSRSFLWLEDLRRDIRLAWRSLRRNPAFCAIVIATLGIGIGASTAVFSVVDALLLTPLPYRDAGRLVRLTMVQPPAAGISPAPPRTIVPVTTAELKELRARLTGVSYLGTAAPGLIALSDYDDAARLQGAAVSAGMLEMLGVQPLAGRLFTVADASPEAEPTIIVSAAAWRRYFQSAPDIIGQSIAIETVLGGRRQTRRTVIGVLPDGFEFPRARTEFWTPIVDSPGAGGGFRGAALGRLADGVSLEAASAEAATVVRELRQGQRGNDTATYSFVLEQDDVVAPVRRPLVVLSGAVICLLLIACVNVANLVVARTSARAGEIALRTALGAGRARIVRYLLTESLVLAVLSAGLGILLAMGGVRLLQSLATTVTRIDLGDSLDFPRIGEVSVNGTVLLFSVTAATITGVLFGLAPAVRYSRQTPGGMLKDAGASPARASTRLRHALVAGEIALAMILLVAGTLLVRSFVNLTSVDTGFRAENVLTFQVNLPIGAYSAERTKAFAEALVDRLKAIPQLRRAGYANQLPMVALRDTLGGLWRTPDANRPPPSGGPDARLVSREYLETMGVRLVAGRGLTMGDDGGAPRVMLVNESLARREFVDESPIGQTVFIGRSLVPWQIVGVVRDVRQFGLDAAPEPQFFIDVRQAPERAPVFPVGAYFAARLDGASASAVPAIRAAVRSLDAGATLFNVAAMEQLVETRIARPRMYAALVGVFAVIGLVLALVGIYGVVAYVVVQRTREIGIRVSLGAQRGDVLALVLMQTLAVSGAGVVAGLLGAFALTRYLEGLLFELRPFDPWTFVSGAMLFAIVAALSAMVPARRAIRIDPLAALRAE